MHIYLMMIVLQVKNCMEMNLLIINKKILFHKIYSIRVLDKKLIREL